MQLYLSFVDALRLNPVATNNKLCSVSHIEDYQSYNFASFKTK